jgi:hypothetical protein
MGNHRRFKPLGSVSLGLGLAFLSFLSIPVSMPVTFDSLGLVSSAQAQESLPLEQGLSQLAQQMVVSQGQGRPLRLAVLPLVAGSGLRDLGMGEYLGNALVTALAPQKQAFRLFERQRLDLVVKEQALSLSELVSGSQAQKLGEILPIDAILTGSYLSLAGGLELQVRLLSAVTGEILFSGSLRASLKTEQLELFQKSSAPQPQASGPPPDPCGGKPEKLMAALKDLSQPAQVEEIVKAAVQIPFDNGPCGKIHYSLIAAFYRYKWVQPLYQTFLQDTLRSLSYTGDDYRMQEILHYFSVDKQIDTAEWEAGLAALEKTPPGIQHIGLHRLIGDDLYAPQPARDQARIDQWFGRVRQGQLGRPRPLTESQAVSQLLPGLRERPDLRFYVLEQFGAVAGRETREQVDLLEVMKIIYPALPANKHKALVEMAAELVNRADAADKIGDKLFDLAYLIEKAPDATAILPDFVRLNQVALANYTREARYTSQKQDRIDFCIRQRIAIPGLIPSVQEASQTILSASDWNQRKTAMDFLSKSNPPAAQTEAALLRLLQLKDLDHLRELQDMQAQALLLLGRQRCNKPEALAFLLNVLGEPHDALAENAQEALVLIGKPAVPALRKKLMGLDLNETGLQYKLVKILARMGKAASEAKPDLQKLLPKARHADVRYAIEAALQAL